MQLELRIRELELENNALNDRVEEIMLFGLISETLEEINNQDLLLASVLEKISILKGVSFCGCYEFKNNELKNLGAYCAFLTLGSYDGLVEPSEVLKGLVLKDSIIRFEYADHPDYITFKSSMARFLPQQVVIFSFRTRSIDNGIFLFMDDAKSSNVFNGDLFLLQQIIRMITDKWDRINLMNELQQMNLVLEDRVSERTLELSRINSRLVREMQLHEVTDRQLKESEEKYRQLFNMANDAIYLWELNEENNVIGCLESNKTASLMTGYSGSELKQMTPNELMTPEYRSRGLNEITKLKQNNGYSFKVSHLKRNGAEIPVEISARMFMMNGKKVMLSIVRDITESKEYEQKLIHAKEKAEEADRLKSTFLANMSHEIRTPMNAIIGFGEILKQNDINNKDMRVYTDIIFKNSLHLLSLINDIVDFSKIEANQVNIVLAEWNINQMLHDLQINAVSLLHNYSKTGIELMLETPLDESKATIQTDGMKLQQVLSNLISNAIKFTNKGFIKIGYRLINDNTLEFCVIDSGIGIDKQAHDSIFERFVQIKEKSTFNLGGTGLGLAICRNLVQMMGGIFVWSPIKVKGQLFISHTHTEPLEKGCHLYRNPNIHDVNDRASDCRRTEFW